MFRYYTNGSIILISLVYLVKMFVKILGLVNWKICIDFEGSNTFKTRKKTFSLENRL